MDSEGPIQLYEWIQNRFTVGERLEFVQQVSRHLRNVVKPGDRVVVPVVLLQPAHDDCSHGGIVSHRRRRAIGQGHDPRIVREEEKEA